MSAPLGIAAAAAAIAASGCAACITPSTSTKRAPSVSRAQSSTGSQCGAGARQARPARRRDRTAGRCRDISRSRPRPAAGDGATPSMIELASRVSGIAAGSILSCCAFHSAASASASSRSRRGQRLPRRGPHRPAVEQHRQSPRRPSPTVACLVEPRPQVRAHVAPRGLRRVERLVLENLLEDVAHRS